MFSNWCRIKFNIVVLRQSFQRSGSSQKIFDNNWLIAPMGEFPMSVNHSQTHTMAQMRKYLAYLNNNIQYCFFILLLLLLSLLLKAVGSAKLRKSDWTPGVPSHTKPTHRRKEEKDKIVEQQISEQQRQIKKHWLYS